MSYSYVINVLKSARSVWMLRNFVFTDSVTAFTCKTAATIAAKHLNLNKKANK